MNIQGILMKMIPVILALVIYDMFVKNLINKYDDSFDSYDDASKEELKELKKVSNQFARKEYRLVA